MEQQFQKILDLWRMIRRRFWLIAIITMLGAAASLFIAYILPPVYQSEAKILVEGQQIPDALARSTVTATAAERLDKIQQQLMSRDNLIRLIEDRNLYGDRPDLTLSQKTERLRSAILILPNLAPGSNFGPRQVTAFILRVTFNDPNEAAHIANALVSTVLNLNAQTRSEAASETRAFFEKQEKELRRDLVSIEVEISTFKRENREVLPDSLEYRRDELGQINENTFDLDRRILTLEEERTVHETRLRQLEVQAVTPSQDPALQQLRELKARLAQLRAVYAEGHREIQAVRAQINALEQSVPGGTEASDAALREAQVAGVRRRVDQSTRQIEQLKTQKQELLDRRAHLQASIGRTPEVEATLTGLERRRDDLQSRLDAVSQKRGEAETGEKLEMNQQAERFSIVENALVPDFPISPNRKRVAALGGMLSIAVAFGLAWLIEMIRPVLRTSSQMQRALDLTPVVSIPVVRTMAERRWRRTRFASLFLILGVGAPAGLYAVDKHVMPLQSVGAKVAEKSGLNNLIRIIKARL